MRDIDCWMPDPKSRDIIGKAMQGNREKWYVQGHLGSTWQNGQYVRTRDMKYVKPAFEDLLMRFQTDYIDIGRSSHNPKSAKLAVQSGCLMKSVRLSE